MVFYSKKGQFLVLGAYFILLVLFVINYSETENTYIDSFSENTIINSAMHETCMVAKTSPGIVLDARFVVVDSKVTSYCLNKGFLCNLTITKKAGAPSNLSLLNYTHYTYAIMSNVSNTYYNSSFTC